MRTFNIGLAIAVIGIGMIPFAHGQEYDLVIANGRVMDPETSYDTVANVGIKAGRIAVISKEDIAGKETIDATGLVVAPGFIDTHFHWTRPTKRSPIHIRVWRERTAPVYASPASRASR